MESLILKTVFSRSGGGGMVGGISQRQNWDVPF